MPDDHIYCFTLPVEPVGQRRPRFVSRGKYTKAYKAKKQQADESKLLGLLYSLKPAKALEGAIELKITAYFPIPKSWPKWRRLAALNGEVRPATIPDWDNIAKMLCDVLNGVWWRDDRQIVGALVRKYYSDNPRWEVEIKEV
jgi:Holliday junction resolvase RusA-like endonuclease